VVLAVAAAMDLVLRAVMAWNKLWKGQDPRARGGHHQSLPLALA